MLSPVFGPHFFTVDSTFGEKAIMERGEKMP
ncbi:unnamed protein product, partial [marine sediment metagenome]